MVWGQIGGAALGAAADILNTNRNIKYQKLFAKKGIQWRVKDAKAAGLHPLYALGAQVPQFSPVQSSLGSDLSAAGQNIGAALERRLTPIQKQALELELQQKNAELRKTIKEGDFLDAEMARIRSDRLRNINEQISAPIPNVNVKESGSAGTVFGGQVVRDTDGVPKGYIEPKAPVSYSSGLKDPGVAAGTSPMMRKFTLPGGLPILLPGGMSGEPSEALESLSENYVLMASVITANIKQFGPQWGDEFIRKYMPGGEELVRGRQSLGRALYWGRSKHDYSRGVPQNSAYWRR